MYTTLITTVHTYMYVCMYVGMHSDQVSQIFFTHQNIFIEKGCRSHPMLVFLDMLLQPDEPDLDFPWHS